MFTNDTDSSTQRRRHLFICNLESREGGTRIHIYPARFRKLCSRRDEIEDCNNIVYFLSAILIIAPAECQLYLFSKRKENNSIQLFSKFQWSVSVLSTKFKLTHLPLKIKYISTYQQNRNSISIRINFSSVFNFKRLSSYQGQKKLFLRKYANFNDF